MRGLGYGFGFSLYSGCGTPYSYSLFNPISHTMTLDTSSMS